MSRSEPQLRELSGWRELEACVDLQRETWGEAFTERVPASTLLVATKTGGIVAGAVDARGRLQGFVFGLMGYGDDGPFHWSHMLAVRSEARGRGLGRRLKWYQRDLLLARGVQTAFWTFDPLVARNAHLNLNRLGAEVLDYAENLYGEETGSPLHGDLGTDRLVVRWRLGSERVRRAKAGRLGGASPERSGEPARVVRGDASGKPVAAPSPPDGGSIAIQVPQDLNALLAGEPQLAVEWRRHTRRAFRRWLGRGYRVAGFVRDEDGEGGAYRLEPGGSSHISSNIE